MSTAWDIEIRPESTLTPMERARTHDQQIVEFERQWGDWVDIARTCVAIDQNQEWRMLGFHSFGEYILQRAPRSRSYLYLIMGRYRELVPDIPEEELAKISLGSAGVLRQLSPAVRNSSKIRQAAKGKPSELRKVLEQEFPQQHMEQIVEVKLKFTASQWQVIETEYEQYRAEDPTASLESFFEFCVSELE